MKKFLMLAASLLILFSCKSPKQAASVQDVPDNEKIATLLRSFLEENGAMGYDPYVTTVVDTVLSQSGETVLYGVRHLYSLTNEEGVRMDTTKAWFALTPAVDDVLYMTGIDWDYNDWKGRYQQKK